MKAKEAIQILAAFPGLFDGKIHHDHFRVVDGDGQPIEELPGPPRQPQVDSLSRRARKAYAKAMRDGSSREEALIIALELQWRAND